MPNPKPVPGFADVRAALERIVASEMFRESPQLVSFLRYVVEATLRGESDRIKGYTIGVEALGRNSHFDPQLDPIVRVEATRLRRTIDRYFAGPGVDDPVIISLSPGSYVPSFSFREDSPVVSPTKTLPSKSRSFYHGRIALISAAVVVAVGVIAGLLISFRAGDQAITGPLEPGNGMPIISLEPIASSGTPKGAAVPTIPLVEKIRDAFARFDTINVVLGPETMRKNDPRIRYRLTGSVEYRADGSANLRFRLFDVADETLVWTNVYERFAQSGDRGAAEDAVVIELATVLVQPFGVIRAHTRNRHLRTGLGDLRYRCIVEASESLRSFEAAQHNRARECLERLIAVDPAFASGFAYLAALLLREYQFGIGSQPGNQATIDRAVLFARQAIEKQPESSRGYQILSAVLFGRGNIVASIIAIEKAIELNKYDMTVLSDYGGRLVLSGEIDRGLAALERAAAHRAIRPSWYNFYFFLGYYLKGDLKFASFYAGQITPDRYPLGHIAHALTALAAGKNDEARAAVGRLVALQPGWRDQPRAELLRLIPSEPIVERILRDLRAAGLSNP